MSKKMTKAQYTIASSIAFNPQAFVRLTPANHRTIETMYRNGWLKKEAVDMERQNSFYQITPDGHDAMWEYEDKERRKRYWVEQVSK